MRGTLSGISVGVSDQCKGTVSGNWRQMEAASPPGEGGDRSALPKLHVLSAGLVMLELWQCLPGLNFPLQVEDQQKCKPSAPRCVCESLEQCAHHAPDLETTEMYISTGSPRGMHRV